jgi:hypothetical protein
MAFDCSASGLAQRRSVEWAATSLVKFFVDSNTFCMTSNYRFSLEIEVFLSNDVAWNLKCSEVARLLPLNEIILIVPVWAFRPLKHRSAL